MTTCLAAGVSAGEEGVLEASSAGVLEPPQAAKDKTMVAQRRRLKIFLFISVILSSFELRTVPQSFYENW